MSISEKSQWAARVNAESGYPATVFRTAHLDAGGRVRQFNNLVRNLPREPRRAGSYWDWLELSKFDSHKTDQQKEWLLRAAELWDGTLTIVNLPQDLGELPVEAMLEKYGQSPSSLEQIADRYRQQKQLTAAATVLEAMLKQVKTPDAYFDLASVYRAAWDDKKMVATYHRLIAETKSVGLEHARANYLIAQHYMGRESWNKALPYAEAAADSYASWALSAAATCNARLNNHEKAEEYFRANASRYGMYTSWIQWTLDSGEGDWHAAGAVLFPSPLPEKIDETAVALKQKDNRDFPRYVALWLLLDGEVKKSKDLYALLWKDRNDRVAGLTAAWLANATEDAEERDRLLAEMSEKLDAEEQKTLTAAGRDLQQVARFLQSEIDTEQGMTPASTKAFMKSSESLSQNVDVQTILGQFLVDASESEFGDSLLIEAARNEDVPRSASRRLARMGLKGRQKTWNESGDLDEDTTPGE